MNNLRFIRKNILHKTMDEFSQEIGISRQLLYTWEVGKTNIPKKRLKQLEEITGIPIDNFFMDNISEIKINKTLQLNYKSNVDLSIKNFSDECLIKELVKRNYVVFKECK